MCVMFYIEVSRLRPGRETEYIERFHFEKDMCKRLLGKHDVACKIKY
jgi:hypothetical protein